MALTEKETNGQRAFRKLNERNLNWQKDHSDEATTFVARNDLAIFKVMPSVKKDCYVLVIEKNDGSFCYFKVITQEKAKALAQIIADTAIG